MNKKTKEKISNLENKIKYLEDVIFVEDYFTKEKILRSKAVKFEQLHINFWTMISPSYTTKENAKLYKSYIDQKAKEVNKFLKSQSTICRNKHA